MTTPIHKELILLEIKDLNQTEIQAYIKEAIAKLAFFYNSLEGKTFLYGDKNFLQDYWKTKLQVLLEFYQLNYEDSFHFLSKSEVQQMKRFFENKHQ